MRQLQTLTKNNWQSH